MPSVVAFDIGSSSGRAVLVRLVGERLSVREVARFAHHATSHEGSLVWDAQAILGGIRDGLTAAEAAADDGIAAIGIDTWGVDYALVDAAGRLVLPLRAYRDGRMHAARKRFYRDRISRGELWRLTGVQPADINTSLQLFADLHRDPALAQRIAWMLMLPDYLGFALTGAAAWGRAICSTSGLCEPGTHAWSSAVLSAAGVPSTWLGQPTADRVPLGTVSGSGVSGSGVSVLRPGGHDTACAVHALSEGREGAAAFISCGSWTLVGAETSQPMLDAETFRNGFTNETRTDGGNRLLKNITGLWLLQECQRKWAWAGSSIDIERLKEEAARSVSLGIAVDVGAEQFMLPDDMPAAICKRTRELYGVEPTSRGQLVRLILESLAVEHARSIDQVDAVTHVRHPVVNLIGGGSRNELLAQMTASACGRAVVAGPAEASAIGNALAQFETLGLIAPHQRQRIVRESAELRRYEPADGTPWQQLRQRLDEALTSR